MDRRSPKILLTALLVAASCAATACTAFEDLDSVVLQKVGGDGGLDDVGDVGLDAADIGADVADTGPDVADIGPDATDVGADADAEIDFGPCGPPEDWTSATDFGVFSPVGACDPVEPQTECDGDPTDRCGISVAIVGGTPQFALSCKAQSSFGDREAGQACGAAAGGADCQQELHCVNWTVVDDREPQNVTCVDLCEMDDDRGCPDGAFCIHQYPELPGLGICVASCDPYDPNACSAGQICAPDFDYPEKTRLPRFRCRRDVENPQAPPAAHGEPCSMGRDDAQYRYCGGEDICYPLTPGEFDKQASCVRPCQEDADCDSLGSGYHCPECGEGPWELRFCEPDELL